MMTFLMRLACRVFASPLLLLPTIGLAGYATWQGDLHPVYGVAIILGAFWVAGSAARWLARDRVTLEPYKARRRLKGRAAQHTPQAPRPTGLKALPMTAARLMLPPVAQGNPAGPPEMMSRLPAGLNRMVVEGMQAITIERKREGP